MNNKTDVPDAFTDDFKVMINSANNSVTPVYTFLAIFHDNALHQWKCSANSQVTKHDVPITEVDARTEVAHAAHEGFDRSVDHTAAAAHAAPQAASPVQKATRTVGECRQ